MLEKAGKCQPLLLEGLAELRLRYPVCTPKNLGSHREMAGM